MRYLKKIPIGIVMLALGWQLERTGMFAALGGDIAQFAVGNGKRYFTYADIKEILRQDNVLDGREKFSDARRLENKLVFFYTYSFFTQCVELAGTNAALVGQTPVLEFLRDLCGHFERRGDAADYKPIYQKYAPKLGTQKLFKYLQTNAAAIHRNWPLRQRGWFPLFGFSVVVLLLMLLLAKGSAMPRANTPPRAIRADIFFYLSFALLLAANFGFDLAYDSPILSAAKVPLALALAPCVVDLRWQWLFAANLVIAALAWFVLPILILTALFFNGYILLIGLLE